jgi:hypothetical protein
MPPFEVRKYDWMWWESVLVESVWSGLRPRNMQCVGVKIEMPPSVTGQPPFEVSMRCVRVWWCCRRFLLWWIVIPADPEQIGFRSVRSHAGVSLQFVRLWR